MLLKTSVGISSPSTVVPDEVSGRTDSHSAGFMLPQLVPAEVLEASTGAMLGNCRLIEGWAPQRSYWNLEG